MAALYLVSYFVVWATVVPVQQTVLPEITKYAWLLFLPHGIRILATSLLGWKAVPGLVAGALIGNHLFWGPADPMLLLAISLCSGCVTWLVFEGLQALGINAYYLRITAEPPNFQTLFIAAAATSIANAFFITSMLEDNLASGYVTRELAAFVTGDITGFLLVVVIAKIIMPLFEGKT